MLTGDGNLIQESDDRDFGVGCSNSALYVSILRRRIFQWNRLNVTLEGETTISSKALRTCITEYFKCVASDPSRPEVQNQRWWFCVSDNPDK